MRTVWDPTRIGVHLGTQEMRPSPSFLTRHPPGFARGSAQTPIEAGGKLTYHKGPSFPPMLYVGLGETTCLNLPLPHTYIKTGRSHLSNSISVHVGIWVQHCYMHFCNSRVNHSLATRGEYDHDENTAHGNVEGRTSCYLPALANGHNLSVVTGWGLRSPLTDDPPSAHYHRTYRGVRRSGPKSPVRQAQGLASCSPLIQGHTSANARRINLEAVNSNLQRFYVWRSLS